MLVKVTEVGLVHGSHTPRGVLSVPTLLPNPLTTDRRVQTDGCRQRTDGQVQTEDRRTGAVDWLKVSENPKDSLKR